MLTLKLYGLLLLKQLNVPFLIHRLIKIEILQKNHLEVAKKMRKSTR